MRSVLILVLTMAFYASVKCGEGAGFDYKSLTNDIKQLLDLKTVKYQQEQSNQQISTLQDQLQSQKANTEDLKLKVSLLSETNEKIENQIEALEKEIEQLKSNPPKVKPDLQWVSYSLNESIPQQSVVAGYDVDEAPIYVGRVYVNGNHIITKVIPARSEAFYSFDGSENSVHNCEILTGSGFSWMKKISNGNLPPNAVSSGKWTDNVPHYIGRVNLNSAWYGLRSLAPGTIQGVNKILYIPFRGREHEYYEYEVLVQNQ